MLFSLFISISPILLISAKSFTSSLLGDSPISMNIPFTFKSCSFSVALSTYFILSTNSFPITSLVAEFSITFIFSLSASLSCNTLSAFISGMNSIKVTLLAIPDKSIAASTPEFPPPITATSSPL